MVEALPIASCRLQVGALTLMLFDSFEFLFHRGFSPVLDPVAF
jgi:hypothetical protein